MTYRLLDLFSGIGGFSLGLERSGGFKTVAFCEIDPFCRRVLAKHWPEVPQYDDIRTLTAERLAADGIGVDAICGGFPCQDISVAGKGAGLAGERSGLWYEYARLIGELRPKYVIVENVGALLSRGLDAVLGTLATLGYDAEWHCIPASAVGAPHRRDRIWLVAYSHDEGPQRWKSDTLDDGEPQEPFGKGGSPLADATSQRHEGQGQQIVRSGKTADRKRQTALLEPGCLRHDWLPEPDVGRVAHGVSKRVDRLRALGNAVVPQIPELIGRAILAAEGSS